MTHNNFLFVYYNISYSAITRRYSRSLAHLYIANRQMKMEMASLTISIKWVKFTEIQIYARSQGVPSQKTIYWIWQLCLFPLPTRPPLSLSHASYSQNSGLKKSCGEGGVFSFPVNASLPAPCKTPRKCTGIFAAFFCKSGFADFSFFRLARLFNPAGKILHLEFWEDTERSKQAPRLVDKKSGQ